MNNETKLSTENPSDQPTVSGHVEPIVMLPCPFCGSSNGEEDWGL